MDVAKIRKKIKEAAGQKPPEKVQEEAPADVQKTESSDTPAIKESAKTPHEAVQQEVLSITEPSVSPGAADEPADEQMEVLAFNVADEEYAVMTKEIHEILRYQDITPVPRAAKYFKGVTSIRGKILPVVDLRERIGLKEEAGSRRKIIILRTSKEPIGILVGLVLDVLRFPAAALLQPPSTLNDEEKNFVKGVVRVKDRFISVLNVEEIAKIS
ncbi:MAG: chemotaxis protein CheW [Nitrospirae bacterium]|nr:chemotaxis protein CheW [Nitrospirota bacterium]MBI4838259.1 chemotaxis protein CheW [Nitrospirota bacterium]